MSESMKPRIAVDLEEIERQLAHAQAAPAHAHSSASTRNDPLAELARIVGQDDPFQTLLPQEQGRARARAAGFEGTQRIHAQPAPHTPQQGVEEPQAYDLDQYQLAAAGSAYHGLRAPSAEPQHGYEDGAYDESYYAEPDMEAQSYPEDSDVRTLQPRRSRKGLVALGAVVVAAAIGGGGAWYATGKSSLAASGQPPLIKASNEPIKVQPDNPGGVEIPNQNKQIYERAKQTTETKVVNREEQPIDVKEATRMASATIPDATGATAASAPPAAAPSASAPQNSAANSLNLGEPKKVRTLSIRPDGTVITDAASNARPATVPAPPAVTLPTAVRSAAPPAVQTAVTQTGQQPVKAAATTPTTPTTPAQKPAVTAPAASVTSPQKVASAQSIAPAATASDATPMAATTAGGFAVQLGVRPSEAEAQSAFRQFQQKYGDLAGHAPVIRKAEVNGATVYRVRIGPMARDEASSLCSKLQGQGGQCFVSKN